MAHVESVGEVPPNILPALNSRGACRPRIVYKLCRELKACRNVMRKVSSFVADDLPYSRIRRIVGLQFGRLATNVLGHLEVGYDKREQLASPADCTKTFSGRGHECHLI